MKMKIITLILLSIFSVSAFAEPQWVEKPIQCATPDEVFERLKSDNLSPLLAAKGKVRIEDKMYVKPFGFFYNQEKNYWAFVEFFDLETMCIIAVGDEVSFDVVDKE